MNKLIRTKPYYKGVTRDFESPIHRTKLVYTPGTTVTTETLNKDCAEDCAEGIHFVASIAAALRWGPVVVEIRVPEGKTIVDSGSKLRAKTVEVGEVVSLIGAELSRANLSGANLSGANLPWANLSEANLPEADLSWANLSGANLSGAELSRANLSGANLFGADLTMADLSRANLSGANLSGADLTMADLSWANLSWANLSGAKVNGTNIALPSGWKIEDGLIVRDA